MLTVLTLIIIFSATKNNENTQNMNSTCSSLVLFFQMQYDDKTVTFRAVTIGESSVGKTCLVNRFIRDKFNNAQPNTVGAIYDTYIENRDDLSVEVQIWDTAGQEKFRSLAPAYYRAAKAAIVVFDITKRSTFQNLQQWIEDFKAHAGDESIIIVVGNKVDLADQIQVSDSEAIEWANARNAKFFKTSAKTGEGVKEVFTSLVDIWLAKNSDDENHGITQVNTKRLTKNDRGGNCSC